MISKKFKSNLYQLIKHKQNNLMTSKMRDQLNKAMENLAHFLSTHHKMQNWSLPEVIFSFINPYNEFISIINSITYDVSLLCDIKLIDPDNPFLGFNNNEILNVIINSSIDHLSKDLTVKITNDTEMSLCNYLKQRSVSYIYCDLFSFGCNATIGGITLSTEFKTKIGSQILADNQKLFLTTCVIQKGKSTGFLRFLEKLMTFIITNEAQIMQTKEESHSKKSKSLITKNMDLIDYINQKIHHSSQISFNQFEIDGYKSFLDVKLNCPTTIFTIQNIPDIVDILEKGKAGFSCSLSIIMTTSFIYRFTYSTTNAEIHEFECELDKPELLKQIKTISILILSLCITNKQKYNVGTPIKALLDVINISSYDKQTIKLFNQIKDSSIIWCLKFLNNVHVI